MITGRIQQKLLSMREEPYAVFQRKLLPTVNPESIIGIRTPLLRKYAKELVKEERVGEFLEKLPHELFEENQLHAFLLSEMKDFVTCLKMTGRFLPYIDNWATCDQLISKCFRKHRNELLPYVEKWISSEHEYTVRFAIGTLMQHFLDDDFDTTFHEMVVGVKREEYYVRMMQAWYFATALAKQPKASMPYIENHRLDPWTHNKTIQKAIESYRISDSMKDRLRKMKVKSSTTNRF